jgi:hypothetical protein
MNALNRQYWFSECMHSSCHSSVVHLKASVVPAPDDPHADMSGWSVVGEVVLMVVHYVLIVIVSVVCHCICHVDKFLRIGCYIVISIRCCDQNHHYQSLCYGS